VSCQTKSCACEKSQWLNFKVSCYKFTSIIEWPLCIIPWRISVLQQQFFPNCWIRIIKPMSSRNTRIEILPQFILKMDVKALWKSESVDWRSNAIFWFNSPWKWNRKSVSLFVFNSEEKVFFLYEETSEIWLIGNKCNLANDFFTMQIVELHCKFHRIFHGCRINYLISISRL